MPENYKLYYLQVRKVFEIKSQADLNDASFYTFIETGQKKLSVSVASSSAEAEELMLPKVEEVTNDPTGR